MTHNLQEFLHQEIPLTKDMSLAIIDFDGQQITLKAPLKNNINDKGSVFGGSSSALMIISAWSLIKLNCKSAGIVGDIVIHKNSTHWKKAQYSDLIAVAKFKKDYDFKQVAQKINNSRHQRITCLIELQDKDAVIYSTMEAKYVIIPQTIQT